MNLPSFVVGTVEHEGSMNRGDLEINLSFIASKESKLYQSKEWTFIYLKWNVSKWYVFYRELEKWFLPCTGLGLHWAPAPWHQLCLLDLPVGTGAVFY